MTNNDKMPGNWARCIAALMHNRDAIAPFLLREARQHFSVGSDFLGALKSLGVMQWFISNGTKYPYLTDAPTAAAIRAQKHKDAERRKARRFGPTKPPPGVRQHGGERTYTKREVIGRFKAFYMREYDRLDDRAYTLCGFLLESLEGGI